jgi:hypothetical protein
MSHDRSSWEIVADARLGTLVAVAATAAIAVIYATGVGLQTLGIASLHEHALVYGTLAWIALATTLFQVGLLITAARPIGGTDDV